MTRVLVGIAFAVGVSAQQFPTSIAIDLPVARDLAAATLSVAMDASTSTISVSSASSFASNMILRIDAEQVKCSTWTLAVLQFTGCQRGYAGTVAASHTTVGATCSSASFPPSYPGCVRGILTEAHINLMRAEIIALEQWIGANGVNVPRSIPAGEIQGTRIPYGTGANILGAKSTFRFDYALDRLLIGSAFTDDAQDKFRILGTGSVHIRFDAAAGNYDSLLQLNSGGNGGLVDSAALLFAHANTLDWGMGTHFGEYDFKLWNSSDVNRLLISRSTGLISLNPTSGSVNIVANASGTASATGIVDFGSAASTNPCKEGTTAPATCGVGQCFFDTDTTAGENLLLCTATDTWTQLTGVGGSGSGYSASFSSQDPLTITQATHGLTTCPSDVKIWSVSGATLTLTGSPDLITCNTSTIQVVVDFSASTSGVVYLEGGGGSSSSSTITAGAPASSVDSCTAGLVRFDSAYIYVCISTDNWKRAALTTF